MAGRPTVRSQDLATLATRGLFWSALSQILSHGLMFLATAILARLLSPDDFGVVAIALVITGLVNLVNELGLGPAIVQRREIDETHLSTAVWANIVSGLILCVVVVLLAPAIGLLFENELVAQVVTVLSVGFIFTSLATVHRAILTRELDFKPIALSDIGGGIAFGLVSAVLALVRLGVWSLAFGVLFRTAAQSALLWFLCPWRPRRVFVGRCFKDLFPYGANVMGTNVLNYVSSNVDYVVIARILGATALGFYSLAYQVISFPQVRLASIVTRVTFPSFSLIQDDLGRLRRAYYKTTMYVSLAIFPVLGLVFVTAPALVPTVYGEGWEPAVLPLRVLCIAGAIYSIGTLMGPIFRGVGRPDLELKLNMVKLLALTSLVILGARFGITGVATAVSGYTITFLFIYQYAINRLIGSGFCDYFRSLYPACVGVFSMSIVLAAYSALSTFVLSLPPAVHIAGCVILGLPVYIATLRILNVEVPVQFSSLVARLVPRRAPHGFR